ncbi:MAG: hypothetical protein J5379_09265 [Clostridiales bacterium]|nr:hypothetical protein [Clostridiales bacterium]
MKLKSLNCKNCNSPLREVDGKLHCDVCGSSFDIEMSAEAQQIEQIHKSIENSRENIEADKRALEEFHRVKEEAQIERERRIREDIEAKMRETRKKAFRSTMIKTGVTIGICIAIVAVMVIVLKNTQPEGKKKATTTTTEEKNYRLIPAVITGDSAFVEELSGKVVDMIKKDHEGSVYESTDDTLYIWNLSADPYIEEYYLLTREDRNYLYMLVAMPMIGKDNGNPEGEDREMVGYVFAYVEDVLVGKDGKLAYDEDGIQTTGSSQYNFMWHADFDRKFLIDEVIGGMEKDPEKPYVAQEFTV